jgi:hypothetical protein
MQDIDKKMHTPCKKEKSRLLSIPPGCTKHTSPEDYKHHLQVRTDWLAVLDAYLDGCIHPRLPKNTGQLWPSILLVLCHLTAVNRRFEGHPK